MNNRTLFTLTGIVLLGMTILLGLNIKTILTGEPENQTYLKYNQVRGIAVQHKELLYTLNFKQQNQVISILNQSVRVLGLKPGKRQRPDVAKIIIYQFNEQPDLVITPLVYVDNNLVYSIPQWNPNGDLMEVSEGVLKELLPETYDP
jgi:hypothetical protein